MFPTNQVQRMAIEMNSIVVVFVKIVYELIKLILLNESSSVYTFFISSALCLFMYQIYYLLAVQMFALTIL